MKIRFIDLGDATFIIRDLEALAAIGHGVDRKSLPVAKSAVPLMLITQFLLEPLALLRVDRLMVHFGGWHALVPLLWARILRRPSILFLHGTDCVSIPAIGYGNLRKQPLARVTTLCYRLAGKLAPVHESLIERTDSYCYAPGALGRDSLVDDKTVATKAASKQGILHFAPGLKTPIDVVHHGFDSENWPLNDANNPDVLITVGFDLHTERIRKLKGIDMILAVAPAFPDRRFVLVGFDQDAGPTIPPNVEVYGRVRRDELVRHYQRAGYYLQLSLSEGFGCALAEAMLCGCIPVVSRAGAPPFIIGRHGAIAETRTVDHVVSVLTDLFRKYDPENHREARAHIKAEFPLARRVAGLSRLLGS